MIYFPNQFSLKYLVSFLKKVAVWPSFAFKSHLYWFLQC